MNAMASQTHDCLLNRLLRCRSKKTSKLHVTGLCAGNSPVTGEIHAQRASNAENVSIWWRHHDQAGLILIVTVHLKTRHISLHALQVVFTNTTIKTSIDNKAAGFTTLLTQRMCNINIISYSEKAWACVQNGITQRGRLADGDMTTSP